MTVCEAVKAAREANCGFRRVSWPEHTYACHGMDNLVVIGIFHSMCPLTPSVALFLQDDWELAYGHPYHHPMCGLSND